MITEQELDRREIESLVREHQERLQRYLHYMGCPRDDIADLVQETFVRLLRAQRRDVSATATAAWLRVTARNLLVDRNRSVRRRPLFEDLDAADRAFAAYDADDGGEALRDALRKCLAGLRPKARTAVELRHGDNLSRSQVAAKLGTTTSAIKILLERARRKLRECVRRRLSA